MTAMGVGVFGREGLSKKEKGLMDMNNSVVNPGGWDIRGVNGKGKTIIKIPLTKKKSNHL